MQPNGHVFVVSNLIEGHLVKTPVKLFSVNKVCYVGSIRELGSQYFIWTLFVNLKEILKAHFN